MEAGKKLTVKGQVIVDLGDKSIFDGQDVKRGGAIDTILVHLISGKGWRAIGADRLQLDLERADALEDEAIEELFYISVTAKPDRQRRHVQRHVLTQDPEQRSGICFLPGGDITRQQSG